MLWWLRCLRSFTFQVEQIHELAVQVGEKVAKAEALGKYSVCMQLCFLYSISGIFPEGEGEGGFCLGTKLLNSWVEMACNVYMVNILKIGWKWVGIDQYYMYMYRDQFSNENSSKSFDFWLATELLLTITNRHTVEPLYGGSCNCYYI